jgi:hypothetical protein
MLNHVIDLRNCHHASSRRPCFTSLHCFTSFNTKYQIPAFSSISLFSLPLISIILSLFALFTLVEPYSHRFLVSPIYRKVSYLLVFY